MKKSYLHSIAIFIICLIITLPIYVSTAYADIQISNIRLYGEDNVDGYIRSNDNLTIELDASAQGDLNITEDQVRLNGDGSYHTGFPFDYCVDPDWNYEFHCNITKDISSWAIYAETSLFIASFNDDHTGGETSTESAYLDEIAPTLNLNVNYYSQDIEFIAEITDMNDLKYGGHASSDDSNCSGIDKVEFYWDCSPADTGCSAYESVPIDTDDCLNTTSLTYPKDTFAEGDHILYAVAYDRMGNPSEIQQKPVTIDLTAPQIYSASIEDSIDSSGEEMEYFADSALPAYVKVDIEYNEDDANGIYDVTADLSGLNYDETTYGDKDYDYSEPNQTGGYVKYIWSIDIKINETRSYEININASDDDGNPASETILKNLNYDAEGPVVTSLETEHKVNGINYVGTSGNTFIAGISDNGVGISPGDVHLNLASLGRGTITAENCTDNYCYWYDENIGNVDEGIKKIYITKATEDKLGNILEDTFEANVTVDTTAPTFNNMQMIVGGDDAVQGYPKVGDLLLITANLTSSDDLYATANLSQIITGADEVPVSCSPSGDYKICEWTTSTIDTSGTKTLYFYFYDDAGNEETAEKTITVYGTLTETVDYWSTETFDSSKHCSPSVVDREIATLINQKVFCEIPLTEKDTSFDSLNTVSMELTDCTGDHILSGGHSIMNAQPNSTNPYVQLTLDTETMDLDQLDITCNLKITSLADGEISPAETEEIPITLGMYNMPLGEYSSEIKEKINKTRKWTHGAFFKTIGSINKFLENSKKICRLLDIYDKIYKSYMAISAGLDILKGTPGEGVRILVCEGTNAFTVTYKSIFKLAHKYCQFVTCDPAFITDVLGGMGGVGKTINEVYEDAQELLDAITINIAGVEDLETIPFESYMDVEGSIVLSTLFLCLPGIVHNLNKIRQIGCIYADCLENIPFSNMDSSECEDMYSMQTCKYFVGELFSLISPLQFYYYFVDMIKGALSDPLSILGLALTAVCALECLVTNSASIICIGLDIGGMLLSIYNDLAQLGEGTYFQEPVDYCAGEGIEE